MISILAHATGVDAVAILAVFALGWILGGLATAGFLGRRSKPSSR